MAREKTIKRVERFIPAAQPAYSFQVKDDTFKILYRDAEGISTSRGLSNAYAIVEPFQPQPTYLPGMFTVRLSPEDVSLLEEIYSTTLSVDAINALDIALTRYLSVLALSDKFPTPAEIADKMKTSLQSLIAVKSLFEPHPDHSLRTGFLDAESTVRAFVLSESGMEVNLQEIERAIAKIGEVLPKVRSLASKPGGKPDLSLSLFLSAILSILKHAGLSVTFPSNSIRDLESEYKATKPVIRFVEAMLDFAVSRGPELIDCSEALDADAKRDAKLKLRKSAVKDQGALLEHLRTARRNLISPRDILLTVTALIEYEDDVSSGGSASKRGVTIMTGERRRNQN